MRRRSRHAQDSADVNVTPLLDIVFIMLIFFIVTATFVRERGLDVTRPNDNQEEEQQAAARVLLLDITQNGQIFANRRPIDISAVRANVETHIAQNPTGGVIISSHPGARSGIAVEVLDQARAGGAAGNVSISIQQQTQ